MNLFAKALFLAVLGLGSQTLYTGAQTTAPAPATNARLPVMTPAPVAPTEIYQVQIAPAQPQPPMPAPPNVRTMRGYQVVTDGNPYAPTTVTGTPYMVQNGTNTVFLTLDTHDAEAARLSRQLADAKSDADKDKLKDKIKELLTKQFDERQKRHEKELEALEAQVKKLKEMVNKRQDNKREIIDERMKQLQRDAQGLGW